MGKVIWTEESTQWLQNIIHYIALDNPDHAKKVVAGIYERAQTVAKFQKTGHGYRIEPEGEIRILLYGHQRIGYLLRKSCWVELGRDSWCRPRSTLCQ